MSEPRPGGALARAARPLVALVLVAIGAPWLAGDQPLYVRGASREAWSSCEERLVRAALTRDDEAYEAVRREALARHLAEGDPVARELAAVEEAPAAAAPPWAARLGLVGGWRPELGAAEAVLVLEAQRDWLDLALEPALRRLPSSAELAARAAEIEAQALALDGGELGRAARAAAAEARAAAASGERRASEPASGAFRALRDALDRWRAGDDSKRRALLGAPAASAARLRVRAAFPALARASWVEVALGGAAFGLALAGAGAWLARCGSACRRARGRVSSPRARALSAAAAVSAALLLIALRASGDEEERRIDYRGEIERGSFALEAAWLTPVPFGPEDARGEPAELPPCASAETWVARGGRAAERSLAPAPGQVRRHLLGTDALGRDVLARLLHGARLSLLVGLLGALAASALGIALGAAAGGLGGPIDAAVRRLIEVLSCFPPLLLALALASARGPSGTTVDAVIGIVAVLVLVRWSFHARIARAEVLRVRGEPFVEAARALGLGAPRLLARHLLPQALPALLVALSAEVAAAMVFESALSFLGLGLSEPSASFGGVLRGALATPGAWWLALFPGLALLAAVLSVHRVGEALERRCAEGLDARRSSA